MERPKWPDPCGGVRQQINYASKKVTTATAAAIAGHSTRPRQGLHPSSHTTSSHNIPHRRRQAYQPSPPHQPVDEGAASVANRTSRKPPTTGLKSQLADQIMATESKSTGCNGTPHPAEHHAGKEWGAVPKTANHHGCRPQPSNRRTTHAPHAPPRPPETRLTKPAP